MQQQPGQFQQVNQGMQQVQQQPGQFTPVNQGMQQMQVPAQPQMQCAKDMGPYYSNMSQQVACPTCQKLTFSLVQKDIGHGTWTCCCLIFSFGLICGCCLAPFFMQDCQDSRHVCSICNTEVGTNRFIFD